MEIKDLVGYKVKRIFMNENAIKFVTDKGNFILTLYSECCSSSYFHDFIGVKNLLKNQEIKKVEEIEMRDDNRRTSRDIEELEFYGFRFTTEDPIYGEVSSVFSFRNSSNGYYGGSLNSLIESDEEVLPEIFDDYCVE